MLLRGIRLMIQTANQQETIQTLKGRILAVYEYLLEQKDTENAEKIKQLSNKLANKEYAVAFCGHFSAGKSTMINNVVGEKLLPSSPIPTSANLVKVKSGDEYAKVFFKNEKPRLYLAPYNYELVKSYCKDGDQIEEIEISHRDSKLPEHTVIMDTPGIDSADDAHRIATESALHLADLVFYVMDYNHVQAELNFLFTKELTEAGKEIYLVINQIDKHNDEELSFYEYQKSVVNSFASWGVKPERIFYTSLKNKDHSENEFKELQKFIAEKLEVKDQLLLPSVFHSLKKITQDHLDKSRKADEEKLAPILETFNDLSLDQRSELIESYQKISKVLNLSENGMDETERAFDHEIAQIMKNAYLMPFQTRELAENYLESCQQEFKVGFLFSKQKTQEEKEARLTRFYKDMLDKTKTQLEWHLREFLLRFLKEKEIDNQELRAKAQAFHIDFKADLLANAVKPGARISGEYVLNYTEEVANEIKKLARGLLDGIKSSLLNAHKEQMAKLTESYKKELNRLGQSVAALEELNKFEQKNVQKEQLIEDFLTKQIIETEDTCHLFQQEEEDFVIVNNTEKVEKPLKQNIDRESKQTTISEKPELNDGTKEMEPLKHMSEKLHHASKHIKDLPGFKKLAGELAEKAGRLENKGFTVALFGAFSAGKSSFANALMGEKVLPVSPNPTTAAINKIKPVNDSYRHGTVLVKFKEEAAMLADVNRSLKVFELEAHDFKEAYMKIDHILSHNGVMEKTHFAFLQAFKKGYDEYTKMLGTILETDVNEFSDFVAKEEKSCYVEWIELYYDCELTRKGITLVDTPGADSINARHTGVAFDYIKNSDAILFVTYYNHAFSKADREFLIQLGRVKDSFQLDKMFFIINAIDLAESEEEKATVAEYVTNQLLKYGIRKPHLHSVSSMLAIQEKKNRITDNQSGMPVFEKSFYEFITHDLSRMAIASAANELIRVHELLNNLILSSQEDQAAKQHKRSNIENQKNRIKERFEKQSSEALQNRLKQEAEELIYYIKQRVFLRLSDFFKEAFNPSTLRDDGRNLKKAVQAALEEFLESAGYDFAQEMRATTVRLDRFAERILADYQSEFVKSLQDINHDLSFSAFEMKKDAEIDFPMAFVDINKQLFNKALGYFKNPKSFFEKNDKKLMFDELNQALNGPADDYLNREKKRVIDQYSQIMETEFKSLINHLAAEEEDFYLSLLAALDGGVPIEQLLEIKQKFTELI